VAAQQALKETMPVVVVEVERHRCALPGDLVDRVVRAAEPSPLPDAPPHVEGVVNVHGTVVPVVDLRARLGLPRREMEPEDQLVLVRSRGRLVALRVDHAVDLVELDREAVAAPDAMTGSGATVSGLVALPDGILLVHDVDAFLTDADAEAIAALVEQVDPESGRPPE